MVDSICDDHTYRYRDFVYCICLLTLTSALVLSVTSITNSGADPVLGLSRKFKISDQVRNHNVCEFLLIFFINQ